MGDYSEKGKGMGNGLGGDVEGRASYTKRSRRCLPAARGECVRSIELERETTAEGRLEKWEIEEVIPAERGRRLKNGKSGG